MAIKLTQINSEGQALQCGLDVFISIQDDGFLKYLFKSKPSNNTSTGLSSFKEPKD